MTTTTPPPRSMYQTPLPSTRLLGPARGPEAKRLRDWAAEDAAQVRRGRVDLYLARDMFEAPTRAGIVGCPRKYSQALIWGALALRQLERKAYRPLEGYVQSLARLCGYEGQTPDHVTIWRRAEAQPLPPLPRVKGPRVIVIDSTGVKVYGAGEWRRHKHSERIRRSYLKLHAIRDAASGEILDWALTSNAGYGSGDGLVGAWMLDTLLSEGLELDVAAGDGAYDGERFRSAVWRGGGRALVPPRRDATLSRSYQHTQEIKDWRSERDAQVLACQTQESRAKWKQESGYHARSLAETTFSRHHALFGERLASKLPERQRLELAIRVWLMNQHAQRSLA